MLPGEADPAVDLHSAFGDRDRGVEGGRGGQFRGAVVVPSAAAATRLRVPSSATSMSAHRCDTAWKLPIGLPNCSRSPAQLTAIASARAATPTESAAAASSP